MHFLRWHQEKFDRTCSKVLLFELSRWYLQSVTKITILTILRKLQIKNKKWIIGDTFSLLSLKTFKIKNYMKIQILTIKMPIELAVSFKD